MKNTVTLLVVSALAAALGACSTGQGGYGSAHVPNASIQPWCDSPQQHRQPFQCGNGQ